MRYVRNLSDTALWVAVYRAMETARPDALFRDRLADRLAGERGRQIAATLRGAGNVAIPCIVRTKALDEMILGAIPRFGIDTVVNLAAGLDSRAYRLPLDENLKWIEVDLPEILSYKEDVLEGERPVCRLETVKLDLADEPARRALFSRIAAESQATLVISEGFILYLTEPQVISLARDLAREPLFRAWLLDFVSPFNLRMLKEWFDPQLVPAEAGMKFAPLSGPDFFKPLGWNPVEVRYGPDEGKRLGRQPELSPGRRLAGLFTSAKAREAFRTSAGFALFENIPV